MALQKEVQAQTGTGESSALDGAAFVLVSPIVIPALLLGWRPVAKTVLKGSLFLTDQLKHLATTTSAGWSDLVAEVRAEAGIAPAPDWTDTRAEAQPPADTGPEAQTISPVNMAIDPVVEPLQPGEAGHERDTQ